MLTPNLAMVDAYLMDSSGQRSESAIVGEHVGVRFDIFVEALSADGSYSVAVTIDGVTKTKELTHGAGRNPGNWWDGTGGWFVQGREYEVVVTVDPENVVAESDETDNSFAFRFTPELSLPPKPMMFPLEGTIGKDFSLGGYVDVDDSADFRDYRGGKFAYNGHLGIDVTPISTELVDAGIPVIAMADGIIIYTQDGGSDFGGGPANGLGIDHGNGWTTHYGHLRQNSLKVDVGQMVSAGEQLGLLGGSGNGALHLHFETHYHDHPIDPNIIGEQFWIEPIPYSGEHLNVMGIEMTNYTPWDTHSQKSWSNFGRLTEFSQSAAKTPVFYKKVTGLTVDDEFYWRLYRPNGVLYASWKVGLSEPLITIPHTFWAFTPVMPETPELGDWVIAVEVNGEEFARRLVPVVDREIAALRIENEAGLFLHPNRYRAMVLEDQHKFTFTNHGTGPLKIRSEIVPEGFELRSEVPNEITAGQQATMVVGEDAGFEGYSAGYVEIHSSSDPSPVYRFAVEKRTEAEGGKSLIVGTERRVFAEGESFSANVRRTGDLSLPVTVQLETSDPQRMQFPATIEFAAGEKLKRFGVLTTADIDLRTSQRSTIRAVATDYVPGQAEIELTEQAFLQFQSLVSQMDEDHAEDLLVGRIYRGNSGLADPLSIELDWDASTGLQLPQSVTIEAGDTWVDVLGSAEDNSRIDGDRVTSIHATAEGFATKKEVSITIVDDDAAGLVVEQTDDSTHIYEPSRSDLVSVALTAEPRSDVRIRIANDLATQAVVSAHELTYTPENWSEPQPITLTALDDLFVEPELSGQLTFAVDSENSDTAFGEVSPIMVPFTITDDDIAAFAVSRTGDSSVVGEDGTTDSFSVVLNARPISNVVIGIVPLDASEVTIQPSVLNFTPNNWNVPQDVTMTGVNDPAVDGTVTSTITVNVDNSASQVEFHDLPEQVVTVTTLDDDTAGFRVTETNGATDVAESGTTDTIDVVLSSQPMTNVFLNVVIAAANEVTADKQTLTFTPANWHQSQSVTLAAVDDGQIEGAQAVDVTFQVDASATDSAFDLLPDQKVVVKIIDDDFAGFTITESGGTTSVAEPDTEDSFSVVLNAEPATNVMLTLTNPDPDEVQLDKTSLTFTPSNWNSPQIVVATGVDDVLADGTQTTEIVVGVDAAASDDAFDVVPQVSVPITTVDDEQPELVLNRIAVSVSEGGSVEEFTVRLTAAPLTDVRLLISAADETEVTAGPGEIVFTTATWNISQTISVNGVDDAIIDGNQTTNVIVMVDDSASDAAFVDVADATVAVTTIDDDEPGFTISKTEATVSESGTEDSFSVVLTTAPSGDVVFNVNRQSSGEVVESPTRLTFTSSNWDVPQTVTLRGVDDGVVDDDQTTVINVAIDAANSDIAFASLPLQTVAVTTIDDDGNTSLAGDVDGDNDFDASDSFIVHLVQLSGTDSQIDQSKGSSGLSATEIRTEIADLTSVGDVDGDGDFDASDSFLIHLVMLSGTNSQVDQSKGASELSASQIRGRVEALGPASGGTRRIASYDNEPLTPIFSQESQMPGGVGKRAHFQGKRTASAAMEISTVESEVDAVFEDAVEEAFRSWIDVL